MQIDIITYTIDIYAFVENLIETKPYWTSYKISGILNKLPLYVAVMGHFGPKCFFLPKLTFGPKISPPPIPRCGLNIKHVVLYARHPFKPFWTLTIQPGLQEGQGRSKYGNSGPLTNKNISERFNLRTLTFTWTYQRLEFVWGG